MIPRIIFADHEGVAPDDCASLGGVPQQFHPGEWLPPPMLPWPLTHCPLVPTQDFGDYSESYYSVQTTEGEQISQLIAGYIDIILKKVCGGTTGPS